MQDSILSVYWPPHYYDFQLNSAWLFSWPHSRFVNLLLMYFISLKFKHPRASQVQFINSCFLDSIIFCVSIPFFLYFSSLTILDCLSLTTLSLQPFSYLYLNIPAPLPWWNYPAIYNPGRIHILTIFSAWKKKAYRCTADIGEMKFVGDWKYIFWPCLRSHSVNELTISRLFSLTQYLLISWQHNL